MKKMENESNSHATNLIPNIVTIFETIYSDYPSTSIYLVGSYSRGTSTPGSDIDVLVFITEDNQDELKKLILEQTQTDATIPKNKIDCKILFKSAIYSGTPLEYLFILSALDGGIHLFGEPMKIKILPNLLLQLFDTFEERLLQIQLEIQQTQNFSINAFLLFSVTKSLYYLTRLIQPVNDDISTPKTILGKYFFTLAREYEKLTNKGVQVGVSMTVTKRGQRSGNFSLLTQAYPLIWDYFLLRKTHFMKWFDKIN